MIRTLSTTRYITPLREGGSLPAIVEADDRQLYVMKFTGAGQGPKALVAELLAGELARALGLTVPEIVFMELDPALGRSEADPEIRELIQSSAGLNLAMRFLPKAFAFNPLLRPGPDSSTASTIVWFDAFVTNVDRTARNTNLLLWQQDLWLIDHGAALYFHHNWNGYLKRAEAPFPLIRDHVLLPFAGVLEEADALLSQRLTEGTIDEIAAMIPDAWLPVDRSVGSPSEQRTAYATYLSRRLAGSQVFLEEAQRARRALL